MKTNGKGDDWRKSTDFKAYRDRFPKSMGPKPQPKQKVRVTRNESNVPKNP